MDPNALDPGTENATRVQNDRHHMYLSCHIEISAKNRSISKNHLQRVMQAYLQGKGGRIWSSLDMQR
jgi:hypothetical protein